MSIHDHTRVNWLPGTLGIGEREAIVLAREQNALFLSDDGLARRVARQQGIPVSGSLSVLHHAKELGLIPNVKELLDEMILQGFRISKQLYQESLEQVGEFFS